MGNTELLPKEIQQNTQELINLAESRILEHRAYLYSTDYLPSKSHEGEDMANYPEWELKRSEARQAINSEQAEIERLKAVLIQEQEEEKMIKLNSYE